MSIRMQFYTAKAKISLNISKLAALGEKERGKLLFKIHFCKIISSHPLMLETNNI